MFGQRNTLLGKESQMLIKMSQHRQNNYQNMVSYKKNQLINSAFAESLPLKNSLFFVSLKQDLITLTDLSKRQIKLE